MTEWRRLYAERNWSALDDWWRAFDNKTDAAELLRQLEADMPRIVHRNGMEEREDYVNPREAPTEWKGAAEILALGELASWVRGAPEPVPDLWRRERAGIEENLRKLAGSGEVTKGDSSQSRAAHADEALKLFKSIDWCTAAMGEEIDPDHESPEDREWLTDFAQEIAYLAFAAGVHTRAAFGKDAEAHAVRGQKTILSAVSGGAARGKQTADRKKRILGEMQKFIDNKHSQSRAADLAFRKGFGRSKNANLQMWKRHIKKE